MTPRRSAALPVLWSKGFIPWNYARFLDYCAERIFLRKVGGGYIFVHRMLMEHFALLDTDLSRENMSQGTTTSDRQEEG